MNQALGSCLAFFLLLSCFPHALVSAAQCVRLPTTSVCSNVLPAGINVVISDGAVDAQLSTVESKISSAPSLWFALTTTNAPCARALAIVQCQLTYQSCNPATFNTTTNAPQGSTGPVPPCATTCMTFKQTCQASMTLIQPFLGASYAIAYNCSNSALYASIDGTCAIPPTTLNDPPIPSCQNLTISSFCSSVIPYPVYVPAASSLAALESRLNNFVTLIQMTPSNSTCRTSLSQFMCQRIYMRCDAGALPRALPTLPIPVPFPSLPCQSTCTSARGACASYLSLAPGYGVLLNCTSKGNVIFGLDDFPQQSSLLATITTPAGPVSVATQCNACTDCGTITPKQESDSCAILSPTSVCANILSYKNVFIPASPSGIRCQDDIEQQLLTLPVVFEAIRAVGGGTNATMECLRYFATSMCESVYRPCSTLDRPYAPAPAVSLCTKFKTLYCAPFQPLIATFLTADVYAKYFTCDDHLSPLKPVPIASYAQPPNANPQTEPIPAVTPIMPQCVTLPESSKCYGTVNYPVYLPAGVTIAQLEAQAFTATALFSLAQVATGCRESMARLFCGRIFTRCTYVGAPVGAPIPASLKVPFPRLPCQSLCQEFQEKCAFTLSILPASTLAGINAVFSCNNTNLFSGDSFRRTQCGAPRVGAPDFPIVDTEFAKSPFRIATQCNDFREDITTNTTTAGSLMPISVRYNCPYPLVVPDTAGAKPIQGGSCGLPCPSILFTEDEWTAADHLMKALTVISFISCVFMFTTWVVFPVKRKQTPLLWFNFCILNLSLCYVFVPNAAPHRSHSYIGCIGNSQVAGQEDGGYCLYQSMISFYFTSSAYLWWLIIALDLYIKLVMNIKAKHHHRYMKISYHIIAWGLPGLLTIIILAKKSFGRSTVVPYCFFRDDVQKGFDWAVFYFLVILAGVIAIFLMSRVMFVMFISQKVTGSRRKPGWWKQYIRPVVFVLQFFVIFTIIIVYRAYMYFNLDKFTTSSQQYVACLLGPGGGTALCGEHPQQRPTQGLFIVLILVIAGQGLWNIIVHGTQLNNCLLWYGLATGRGMEYGMDGTWESSNTSRSHDAGVTSTSGRNSARRHNKGGATSQVGSPQSAYRSNAALVDRAGAGNSTAATQPVYSDEVSHISAPTPMGARLQHGDSDLQLTDINPRMSQPKGIPRTASYGAPPRPPTSSVATGYSEDGTDHSSPQHLVAHPHSHHKRQGSTSRSNVQVEPYP